MYSVARSALVCHSSEEMYSLVNDIDSYARFLPWCGGSEVLSHCDDFMRARVDISYRNVRQSFVTDNRLQPYERINMSLVDGPFASLSGAWEFKSLRADGCRIALDLRFDFASKIVGGVVGPVFQSIADSMVDSFVRRAAEIYADAERDADTIRVEVVYASPDEQVVEAVTLPVPATIADAIRASKIPTRFAEIDATQTPTGVFGRQRPADWLLADNDRVEIYRPLTMSPTDARRRRANIADE